MKKLLLVTATLILAGCKGPAGNVGPIGTSGAPGYTANFQNGGGPTADYSGGEEAEIGPGMTGPTNIQSDNQSVTTVSSGTGYTVILTRYALQGWIPSDATITSATLSWILENQTLTAGSVTLGVYSMATTWNAAGNTSVGWQTNWLGVAGQAFTATGVYNNTPLSAVTVASSATAGTVYSWSITPSIVQGWLANQVSGVWGPNDGIAIFSENQGADTAHGAIEFYASSGSGAGDASAAASSNNPTLVVTYTLP